MHTIGDDFRWNSSQMGDWTSNLYYSIPDIREISSSSIRFNNTWDNRFLALNIHIFLMILMQENITPKSATPTTTDINQNWHSNREKSKNKCREFGCNRRYLWRWEWLKVVGRGKGISVPKGCWTFENRPYCIILNNM